MKIAFYDTKPYDKIWFPRECEKYGYEIKFCDYKLGPDTAVLASGYETVCVFVNDTVSKEVIDILHRNGTRLLALRCAGYNNVELEAARGRLRVVRVPNYSPAAVAEHAMALLLSINRGTYRAYSRTRDLNFSINGLMGADLRGKTVGVVGTGRIGRVFIEIARGFGMRVLAYEPAPKQPEDFEYVGLDELFRRSDVISLHCPLTPETYHLVNSKRIDGMKDGVLLINTSRGALIDTSALLDGLKSKKIGGAGLDVYEEEENYFFEDLSNEIIEDDELARLLTFPNVLVTSHQGFFTAEAMQAIAETTMGSIDAFARGEALAYEL